MGLGLGRVGGWGWGYALRLDLGDDVLALAHAVKVGEHGDGLARLDGGIGGGVQHDGLVERRALAWLGLGVRC